MKLKESSLYLDWTTFSKIIFVYLVAVILRTVEQRLQWVKSFSVNFFFTFPAADGPGLFSQNVDSFIHYKKPTNCDCIPVRRPIQLGHPTSTPFRIKWNDLPAFAMKHRINERRLHPIQFKLWTTYLKSFANTASTATMSGRDDLSSAYACSSEKWGHRARDSIKHGVVPDLVFNWAKINAYVIT